MHAAIYNRVTRFESLSYLYLVYINTPLSYNVFQRTFLRRAIVCHCCVYIDGAVFRAAAERRGVGGRRGAARRVTSLE